MTTITRRKAPRQSAYPVGYFWLRFVSGGHHLLTVDPERCPYNIHAAGHWTDDPDGAEVYDEFHAETVVLGRCRCVDNAPADWAAFCDLAAVAPDTTRTWDDLAARYHRETGERIHPDTVAALAAAWQPRSPQV